MIRTTLFALALSGLSMAQLTTSGSDSMSTSDSMSPTASPSQSATSAEPSATSDATPTVYSLMVPTPAPRPSEASVIGADKDAITFGIDIGCLPSMFGEQCDVADAVDSITITQGPKTFHQSVEYEGLTLVQDCKLEGYTLADCVLDIEGKGTSTELNAILTGYEMNDAYVAVTVTAGLENLKPTSAGAEKTSSPNSMPRVTGEARWVIGGAAAALAAVAAL
ncbi:hypothetical protein FQN52_001165 [Onygenales sp. PD_12]|nr:hypothetical protein FQN52_001165 [Onygenales sp. PD_12]